MLDGWCIFSYGTLFSERGMKLNPDAAFTRTLAI